MGYLRIAPTILCWRQADEVTIRWQLKDPESSFFAGPWTGEAAFVAAIEEFDQALMAAMEVRIVEVVADPPPVIAIDLPRPLLRTTRPRHLAVEGRRPHIEHELARPLHRGPRPPTRTNSSLLTVGREPGDDARSRPTPADVGWRGDWVEFRFNV